MAVLIALPKHDYLKRSLTLKKPRNPLLKRILGSLFTVIQTPLRTAFHDTQRLLLEAYSSNICSDSVLFAPLMKK